MPRKESSRPAPTITVTYRGTVYGRTWEQRLCTQAWSRTRQDQIPPEALIREVEFTARDFQEILGYDIVEEIKHVHSRFLTSEDGVAVRWKELVSIEGRRLQYGDSAAHEALDRAACEEAFA